MEKKILVITGANTAREEGPVYPDRSKMQGLKFVSEVIKWNNKQSSLKEYRITHIRVYKESDGVGKDVICPYNGEEGILKIGSKVQCEVNEETLEAIIL